ncbi:hypothetical protein [Bradyrhizobium sp. STM 3562]|uniref:hypothetical protein n=1 Tax=Bradyrhizobium sp. STM 3562 TaxID=578924 RepID=UPI00388DB41E
MSDSTLHAEGERYGTLGWLATGITLIAQVAYEQQNARRNGNNAVALGTKTPDLQHAVIAIGEHLDHPRPVPRPPRIGFGKRHGSAWLTGIWAKTLGFFGASRACSIDFRRFHPMFPVEAAGNRTSDSAEMPPSA